MLATFLHVVKNPMIACSCLELAWFVMASKMMMSCLRWTHSISTARSASKCPESWPVTGGCTG